MSDNYAAMEEQTDSKSFCYCTSCGPVCKVHIFKKKKKKSNFQGFLEGVKVGCTGWAHLWRSFKSFKLQAVEVHCHPFKGMTITLVSSLLIRPPDSCHQRSTSLSLNVLLLARAAESFYVCDVSDEYVQIKCLYLHLGIWTAPQFDIFKKWSCCS